MVAVAILSSDPLSDRGLREILVGVGLHIVDDPTDADVIATTGEAPDETSAPVLHVSKPQHPSVLLLDLIVGRIAGIVLVDREAVHLELAVHALASGERWLDPSLTEEMIVAARRGTRWRGPAGLTAQELRVLRLLDQRTNRQIADTLGISSETVRAHLRSAVSKLGAYDRIHAVEVARTQGIIH